ncbi:MAG: hypothetical protein AAGM22_20975 [Acidobacteriota bacterium]
MTRPFTLTLEDLPAPTLRRFVADYEAVAPPGLPLRHRQLIPWCWRASQTMMLTPLPESRACELIETNLLAIVLNVMIDDLADTVSEDATTLEQALGLLDGVEPEGLDVKPEFAAYLALVAELRREILARIRRAPAYSTWSHDLELFVGRFQVAMRHGGAWNRRWQNRPQDQPQPQPQPPTPTFDDFLELTSAPIHSFIYGLLHLMQLDGDVGAERTAIVETLRCGEQFLAMSNWLATWRVEIADRDFTSGVLVWALERGVLTPRTIRTLGTDELIHTLDESDLEPSIERSMDRRLERMADAGRSVTLFDVAAYRLALEHTHVLHRDHREVLKS